MSQNIVPSRDFSDKTLTKIVIGKLCHKRASWIEKLCCGRPSWKGVNSTIKD